MADWQQRGYATHPSACFAMSQSPPSQSPIRRTMQGTPSSEASDGEDPGHGATGGAEFTFAPADVQSVQTAPMPGEHAHDHDGAFAADSYAAVQSRQMPMVNDGGPLSRVQVLTQPFSEEEDEACEEEEGACQGEGMEDEDACEDEEEPPSYGLAPTVLEPVVMETAIPFAAPCEEDANCGDCGEEGDEGDQGDEGDEGDEGSEEAQCDVLVPNAMDATAMDASLESRDGSEGLNQQVITAQHCTDLPADDAWGSTLPPEATDEWTVLGDVCCLQVAGREMKLPRSVYDRLYGYQRKGIVWMWNLFHKGFGGILADEMGLGKTVQTAAFLACLKFTALASRFLVVVNVTLLEQWRRELSTWARDTGLAVHVMHGSPQERRAALRGMMSKGGVLLVSYDGIRNGINFLRSAGLVSSAVVSLPRKRKRQTTTRGCRDDDSPSEEEEPQEMEESEEPERVPWDVVVVDEAHQLKNPSCVSGRALRQLLSRSRFLLTGTPLQNKLSDLWALMDFAQPALLGNHATFERSFSEQIAKGSKRNASRFAVELKDHLARELKRLTAPHFLRRLKSEVAAPSEGADQPQELPPKMDVVLWLNLTPAQQELYNLYLGSDVVRRATGQSKCGMEALRAIALLKKLCNHPLLCLPPEDFNSWRSRTVTPGAAPAAAEAAEEGPAGAGEEGAEEEGPGPTQPAAECQQALPRLRALLPNSVEGAALLSCKLRVLSVLLPQLHRRGHRCLIFSQSTRMLDLIQACVLRTLGLKFLRIDGTIDAKDRDLKISKFHQPDSRYFCICLSIQVGGIGLTITGADRVILVDPAWNPSMDAQAIDRVHRIGQQREVVVYRLIGAGAIEDKMFRLQVFKRSLSKTYLEQEQQVRFFTHKELKQLFEPPSSSTSTQSLMAEQIGTEALEHEELLRVVAGDIGSTDDPQALPFWQSSDVLGFSDYQRLFMFLEQANRSEEEAVQKAQALTAKLKSEEYVKDQVVDGKWRGSFREGLCKENVNPQEAADVLPLQDLGG